MKSGGNFVGGWKKRVHGRGEGYGIVNYCLKDSRIHGLRSLHCLLLHWQKKPTTVPSLYMGVREVLSSFVMLESSWGFMEVKEPDKKRLKEVILVVKYI